MTLARRGSGLELAASGSIDPTIGSAGIDLTSVTDVVLTHLHMAHIGGLLVGGVRDRLRPDLRIHLAAAEAEFWRRRFLSRFHAAWVPRRVRRAAQTVLERVRQPVAAVRDGV